MIEKNIAKDAVNEVGGLDYANDASMHDSAEKLKIILETAIREEEYFYRFYQVLSDLQSDEDVKNSLLQLSKQEKLHSEKLHTLSFEKLGANIVPELFDLVDLDSDVVLTPMSEFEDLHTMFKFAIKQEALAKGTYSALAAAINDESAKQLLLNLAQEEEMHEQLLVAEYKKVRGEK